MGALQVRIYGRSGPTVVVLHGGPGAPGTMAPVARELAREFRVLEPFQRRSGGPPLTVARHVADLHELIAERCGDGAPALVGHSWGAMLALAFAAAHPGEARALVLVGCGTFDPAARASLEATVAERVDAELGRRLDRLADSVPDPDERLRAMGELLLPVYSHDLQSTELELERCDARGHEETWRDALAVQEQGLAPAAFAAIEAPVLMLHGDADPHPGREIRDGLRPFVARLSYRELRRSGHYPWLEREARDEFFALSMGWLGRELGRP